jgi:hypothetical protein
VFTRKGAEALYTSNCQQDAAFGPHFGLFEMATLVPLVAISNGPPGERMRRSGQGHLDGLGSLSLGRDPQRPCNPQEIRWPPSEGGPDWQEAPRASGPHRPAGPDSVGVSGLLASWGAQRGLKFRLRATPDDQQRKAVRMAKANLRILQAARALGIEVPAGG